MRSLERAATPTGTWDYIYEPDAKVVLDQVLTRYIEALIYQAVAENMASEQSARMVAMKAASDNAGSVIDELTLVYNKSRQARSPRSCRRSWAARRPFERTVAVASGTMVRKIRNGSRHRQQGTIVQCIGAVIDIEFPREAMPTIYDALKLEDTARGLAEKGLTLRGRSSSSATASCA